jgi:hypothetical protein
MGLNTNSIGWKLEFEPCGEICAPPACTHDYDVVVRENIRQITTT